MNYNITYDLCSSRWHILWLDSLEHMLITLVSRKHDETHILLQRSHVHHPEELSGTIGIPNYALSSTNISPANNYSKMRTTLMAPSQALDS